jgi:hypothetical protein
LHIFRQHPVVKGHPSGYKLSLWFSYRVQGNDNRETINVSSAGIGFRIQNTHYLYESETLPVEPVSSVCK